MLFISFANTIATSFDCSLSIFISLSLLIMFIVAFAKFLMLRGVDKYSPSIIFLRISSFRAGCFIHLQSSFRACLYIISFLCKESYEGFLIFNFFSNSLSSNEDRFSFSNSLKTSSLEVIIK